VIKTRILSTSSNHPGAYSSFADGARQIFRSDGLHGFYRGLVPSLLGVSHGALQFMMYEKLKISRRRKQRDLGSPDILILSGIAKVFAGSVTYPYQVVRARLQMYNSEKFYNGATDVVIKVWKQEGMKGFYKGLGPNLIRVLPSTWVTFLVYEKTRLFLQDCY
jgi:solute carrier family 25 (mitochondrial folate transporter), member 32